MVNIFDIKGTCKVAWSTYKLEKWNKGFSRQICIHNWLEWIIKKAFYTRGIWEALGYMLWHSYTTGLWTHTPTPKYWTRFTGLETGWKLVLLKMELKTGDFDAQSFAPVFVGLNWSTILKIYNYLIWGTPFLLFNVENGTGLVLQCEEQILVLFIQVKNTYFHISSLNVKSAHMFR